MIHNHFTEGESERERRWGPLTGEQVVVVLPQFDGSLVQLPGALPGFGTQPGPHVLHALFVIRV